LSAFAVAYDWIVLVGVARITKIVAPLALSFEICEATLGAVTSNGSLSTMFDALAPRPASRPVM